MTNLKNSQQKVSQLYCFKIYQRTYFMFKFEKFDWLKAQSHAILIVCNVKTINYWRNMITSPQISMILSLTKIFQIEILCIFSYRMGRKAGRSNWRECMGRQLGWWRYRRRLFCSVTIGTRKSRDENGELNNENLVVKKFRIQIYV